MAYLSKPSSPLTTPTPAGGLGQGVHPSVIDFLPEHGIASWAGHRYWMAFTPYPNGDDRYENPCLLVSSDGLNWSVPVGITNPLTLGKTGYGPNGEPDTHDSTGAFNADPCLVYQPEVNELWVFFASGKTGFSVFKIPETLVVPQPVSVGHGNMSVSVLRDPATGDLHYWDLYPGTPFPSEGWQFQIRYRKWLAASSTWASSATFCNAAVQETMGGWGGTANWYPWHIDTKLNPHRGTVEMLVAVTEFPQGNGSHGAIGLLETTLDNPTLITNPLDDFLLSPAVGTGSAWDRSLLYKATQVVGPDGLRRIWYSAMGGTDGDDWRIGYTEGYLPLEDIVPDGDLDIILDEIATDGDIDIILDEIAENVVVDAVASVDVSAAVGSNAVKVVSRTASVSSAATVSAANKQHIIEAVASVVLYANVIASRASSKYVGRVVAKTTQVRDEVKPRTKQKRVINR